MRLAEVLQEGSGLDKYLFVRLLQAPSKAFETRIAGDVMRGQKIAGEALAGLDAREVLGRADGGDAGGPECVGDTGRQWGFRADDSESGSLVPGKGRDRGAVNE